MKKLFPLLALMPLPCFAETYLCIPDVAAAVTSGGKLRAEANVVDVSDRKWLLLQVDGKWVVKEFASEIIIFGRCSATLNLCDEAAGYRGVFIRDEDNSFAISFLLKPTDEKTPERRMYVTAAGKCSKI